MSRKTTAKERLPVAAVRAADEDTARQEAMESLAQVWLGMPWTGWWMQGWNAWLQQYRVDGAAADPDDRRNNGLPPWLPKVESTVVPFRRRDDPPGAEGARISLRVRMPSLPWTEGSGSVISIDTLTPRGAR